MYPPKKVYVMAFSVGDIARAGTIGIEQDN